MEEYKELLKALCFKPKPDTTDIHYKEYSGYTIEVDFENPRINYGGGIRFDNKSTQNFSQPENFVVLECVNRLLEKGYKPENIFLEKTYNVGHNPSGRLDILVTNEKDEPYLMIECKTYGKEFNKAFERLKKDGGQLFTYFQQDKKTELLMLYTCDLKGGSETKIIKVDDKLRYAGNVHETHNFWDRKFYETGFWNEPPYNFRPKKFTKKDLRELTETEGRALFNKFATILRKHSVSDKPNAFNKIFNLFVAKLYDELKKDDETLEFHWRENDHPVDFQVRLFNLHAEGLRDFLKKTLTTIKPENFDGTNSQEELREKEKDILKINKIYDIKEVFDDDSFYENHRVLKEVVELLQQYQIKYPRKQRYLSEFFEQLLTTGLKQEAGQYFTPPAITKFIVKSLPLYEMVEKEINQKVPTLPAVIDYAAGSGHFLTEVLEEYQDIIEKLNTSKFYSQAEGIVLGWRNSKYSWAKDYIYGIEKDYRLVKVAKVGCYFYGDGLAQVVLGDGLDSLKKSKSYNIGFLRDNAKEPQFSILVSNPPYSVDGVRDDIEYIGAENEFTLFKYLTYNSSEIEALFVERAKQLLKDGGVAGIILPSSILSNSGIYTKAREIILQDFDIVAITQLGSNTFMATGTNTIVLFFRKRNIEKVKKLKEDAYKRVQDYIKTKEDKTISDIEKPIKKYLEHTSETEINPEKFYYFVLNYHQKVVMVTTGVKEAEKKFLGYEFSSRRRSEGMHSIQRDKSIDECTRLYDDTENKTKVNFYIRNAFNNNFPKIHESLKDNVSYINLIDMITFDRAKFEKTISTAVRKVKIKSKYPLVPISEIITLIESGSRPQGGVSNITEGIYSIGGEHIDNKNGYLNLSSPKFVPISFYEKTNKGKLQRHDLLICKDGALTGKVAIVRNELDNVKAMINEHVFILRCQNLETQKYLFHYLFSEVGQALLRNNITGAAQGGLNSTNLRNIKIPLPPLAEQKKIVVEMEKLEKKENETKEKIENGKYEIKNIVETTSKYPSVLINDVAIIQKGTSITKEKTKTGNIPVIAGGQEPAYFHNVANRNGNVITVSASGAYAGFVNYFEIPIFASDCNTIQSKDENNISTKLIYYFLKLIQQEIYGLQRGQAQPHVYTEDLANIKLPLPPLAEQKKIVKEIENIETEISEAQKIIDDMSVRKKKVLEKYGISS